MSEPRSYLIRRAHGPVSLRCDDPAWAHAETLAIDQYPWYVAGQRQGTSVAVLYDAEALYALFICEDRHIHAVETRPNGNVYLDSCVELFAAPGAADGGYFNFEANCCGTVHLGWGPARGQRRHAPPEVLGAIPVRTSIPTATREESPTDDGWWLAVKMPFSAIARLAGAAVKPAGGTVWRANFQRCGGKTDGQYACWNLIEFPKPDYHRPEFFGTVTFE